MSCSSCSRTWRWRAIYFHGNGGRGGASSGAGGIHRCGGGSGGFVLGVLDLEGVATLRGVAASMKWYSEIGPMWGRNGFDGFESLYGGVPGSELP